VCLPPLSDQKRLVDSLLPFPAQASHQEAILKILFARTMGGNATLLTGKEISESLPNASGPHGVRNTIALLRKRLNAFFSHQPVGSLRMEIVGINSAKGISGGYVLSFSIATEPTLILESFFRPYFDTFWPTRLYFPEPPFYKHRSQSYVRSLKVREHSEESKRILQRQLNLAPNELMPSYSFVPSGTARALSQFYECFHQHDAALEAKPMRPGDKRIAMDKRNVHLLVLATPTTSMTVLDSPDGENFPRVAMRSMLSKDGQNAFQPLDRNRRPKGKSYVDEVEQFVPHDELAPVPLTKYAILTRRLRYHPANDDGPLFTTILAGHSHSIHALAKYLTMEEGVTKLYNKFGGRWPQQFQALFEVPMTKRAGRLSTKWEDVRVKLARPIR
jgi:hypothetical protein